MARENIIISSLLQINQALFLLDQNHHDQRDKQLKELAKKLENNFLSLSRPLTTKDGGQFVK
jgi:hypothetical protein